MRLWNPSSGGSIGNVLTGHTGMVTAVALSRERPSNFASAGTEGVIRRRDPVNRRPIGELLAGHMNAVTDRRQLVMVRRRPWLVMTRRSGSGMPPWSFRSAAPLTGQTAAAKRRGHQLDGIGQPGQL